MIIKWKKKIIFFNRTRIQKYIFFYFCVSVNSYKYFLKNFTLIRESNPYLYYMLPLSWALVRMAIATRLMINLSFPLSSKYIIIFFYATNSIFVISFKLYSRNYEEQTNSFPPK